MPTGVMEPRDRIDLPSTVGVRELVDDFERMSKIERLERLERLQRLERLERLGEVDHFDGSEHTSPDLSSTPRDFDSSRDFDSTSILRSKESFTSYHRPMRSETPTSTASTISTTGLWLTGQDFRSMTPSDDGSLSRPTTIGMALGSPSHLPPPQYTTEVWAPFQPSVITTVEAQRPFDKKQPRKWGIFTRTRSKKGRSSDPKQDVQQTTPTSSPLSGREPTPDNGTPSARYHNAPPKPRTLVKARVEPRGTHKGNRLTKSPAGMSRSPSPQIIGSQGMGGQLRDGSPLSPNSPPEKLLDVEIPDVSMERYSVMFGHLIQDLDSTSLHGRRQASRDRLKAIKDDHAQDQSPTWPPPSAAAASRAAPARAAARDEGIERIFSPAQRSNSFPETLTSPIHPGPSPSTKKVPRGKIGGPHHVAASSRSGAIGFMEPAESSSTELPRLISRFHRRSSSDQGPSPHAPAHVPSHTIPDGELHANPKPFRGDGISPMTWNTAHPPHPLPNTVQKAAASPSTTPPIATSPPQSRGTVSSEGQQDQVFPEAVQVSIARQISVSRQQSAMLESLRKPGVEGRHVSETKSSRPQLVDPRQDLESPTAMHRMSEPVIVEGA